MKLSKNILEEVNKDKHTNEEYLNKRLNELYDEILTLAYEAAHMGKFNLSKKLENILGILDFTKVNESLKESKGDFTVNSDPVEILAAIHNQYQNLAMEDEFYMDVLNRMNLSVEDLINWYDMGEEDPEDTPTEEIKPWEKY